ncbi:MAG TPA: HAD family phosphatase [Propionibacterium sp.]|nr:HAD family phosphatase [Propionibacterium sp.]
MDVRLIATDVDGTLLRSDHVISARNREAFAAARASGIDVLAISGRQPYSIGAIVAASPLEGFVVGSNGSVAVDLATRSVLFEELLDLEAQRTLALAILERFPDAHVVSVRDAGNSYVAQHGYTGDQDPGHEAALWPVSHRFADLDEVLSEPSVKLVIKHPDRSLAPEQLLAVARDLAVPGTHPTTSGAPFLEVGRAGVSKATALARFAADRGIEASQVVTFGDNLNDVEMLRWAGLGVAMGNAVPGAIDAADEVTLHHDADGVAVVIERLLGITPGS